MCMAASGLSVYLMFPNSFHPKDPRYQDLANPLIFRFPLVAVALLDLLFGEEQQTW